MMMGVSSLDPKTNARPSREGLRHSYSSGPEWLEYISDFFYFFFGGSLFGLILLLVGSQLSRPFGGILSLVAGIWIGWAVADVKFSTSIKSVAMAILIVVGAVFTSRGLALLAAGDIYHADRSEYRYFYAQIYLWLGILWLLVGVPHRAFKYKLDPTGDGVAQRVMLGGFVTGACILTGIFILTLHLGQGPLSQVSIGPLIVGDIVAVVFIAPIFRSLAKACWQRGVIGIFSLKPLIKNWQEAAIELGVVTDKRAQEWVQEVLSQRPREEAKRGSISRNDRERGEDPPTALANSGSRPVNPPDASRKYREAPGLSPDTASKRRNNLSRAKRKKGRR